MTKKEYITIEKETYNKALNFLMDADMPAVTFRKDDNLAMANEAISKLRQAMMGIAVLLQSGNPNA